MVKISFFLIFCLFLIGCNRNNNVILVQNNELLRYVNFDNLPDYDFPIKSAIDYPIISDFSLDAVKQSEKVQINDNDSKLIARIIEKFKEIYFGGENNYFSIDTTSQRNIYFCGKISANESINSFLILIEEPDMYFEISESFSSFLYLLNYKNSLLTSIVEVSVFLSGIDDGISIISYYMSDMYFSQINYSFVDSPMYYSVELYIPTKEIREYISITGDARVLYFSTFIIDENGFVQLINV